MLSCVPWPFSQLLSRFPCVSPRCHPYEAQHIPLHLLNRKFIKDIDELYGDYQAGEGTEERTPLTTYTKTDVEPSIVRERGNA